MDYTSRNMFYCVWSDYKCNTSVYDFWKFCKARIDSCAGTSWPLFCIDTCAEWTKEFFCFIPIFFIVRNMLTTQARLLARQFLAQTTFSRAEEKVGIQE